MIDAETTLLPHVKCTPGLGVGHKEYDFQKTYSGLIAYQFDPAKYFDTEPWHWELCGDEYTMDKSGYVSSNRRFIYTSDYCPELFWPEVYKHFKDTEYAPIIMAEILGAGGSRK
jgi:hypothetical protein